MNVTLLKMKIISPEKGVVAWSSLVVEEGWKWVGHKLFHSDAIMGELEGGTLLSKSFRSRIVNKIYATHNQSFSIRGGIESVLSLLGPDDWGLNLGSGGTRLHSQLINLDITEGPNTDVVVVDSILPFRDDSLDVVISQEVLEHIPDFQETINEVVRVLKPGGVFYCQVPFQIGFHPGPVDCWRFSVQGLRHLFTNENWEVKDLQIAVGHGTGFYRIAVEFFAVTASIVSDKLYIPVKGFMALLLYPVKFFDILTKYSSQKDRIPGGYYCIARKRL